MVIDIEFEIKEAISRFDKPVSWTEIVHIVEEYNGYKINPNAMHYHLKQLRAKGEVIQISIGEQTYYTLPDSS